MRRGKQSFNSRVSRGQSKRSAKRQEGIEMRRGKDKGVQRGQGRSMEYLLQGELLYMCCEENH